MVPGSLGCGVAVLAAMTTLAPSCAALKAMALPMPLLAPVMKRVRPARVLHACVCVCVCVKYFNNTYPAMFFVVGKNRHHQKQALITRAAGRPGARR